MNGSHASVRDGVDASGMELRVYRVRLSTGSCGAMGMWGLPSPSGGDGEGEREYKTVSANAEIPVIDKNWEPWEHRGGNSSSWGGVRESSREKIPVLPSKELVGVCQAKKMGIGKTF